MIRRNALSYGLPLGASALLLAACGGASPTGGTTSAGAPSVTAPASVPGSSTAAPAPAVASAALDSCSLITSQEASVALGVDAGTPQGVAGQCSYATSAGSMTIIAASYPSASTAQASYATTRSAAQAGVPGFQDLTGIGDHAFVTSSGLVEFSKGESVVIIQVLSANSPSISAMTTLAQAALGRV
jgi:hypothetical protein